MTSISPKPPPSIAVAAASAVGGQTDHNLRAAHAVIPAIFKYRDKNAIPLATAKPHQEIINPFTSKWLSPEGNELVGVRLSGAETPDSGDGVFAFVDPKANQFWLTYQVGDPRLGEPTTTFGPAPLPTEARFEGPVNLYDLAWQIQDGGAGLVQPPTIEQEVAQEDKLKQGGH